MMIAAVALFCATVAQAQLRVSSQGKVAVGTTANAASTGTGQQVLEGLLVVRDTMTIVTNQPHYGTILVINNGQLTIRNEVEIVGNGKVIIESGGKLIIDGGVFSNVELSFEAGASLEIKNGGVLIPRNHLIIPLGVEIKIEQGQIVLNDEDD